MEACVLVMSQSLNYFLRVEFDIRRPLNTRLMPKYTRKTVRYGGDSVLVWGFSSVWGPLHKINRKIDRFLYQDILQNCMIPYVGEI